MIKRCLDLLHSDGSTSRHFFSTVQIEIGEKPHLIGIGIDVSAEHALGLELALQKEKLASSSRRQARLITFTDSLLSKVG